MTIFDAQNFGGHSKKLLHEQEEPDPVCRRTGILDCLRKVRSASSDPSVEACTNTPLS